MTRRIAAHKGGRTARAPEARIRPQTLQRIRATMRERDKSFGDLLEEQYGGNEMTKMHIADYTTGDLAASIMGMHDEPYNQMLNRATLAIDAAIAAAVQAEREACAQECEAMVLYPGGRQKAPKHNDVWAAAAAIRARNGAGIVHPQSIQSSRFPT